MTQLPNQYNRSDSLKLVFEKRKTNRVFCITTNRLLKKNHFLYVLLCFIQSIVTSYDWTYREHWTWSINRLWHYFLTLQFKYIAQASDISIFCTLPYSKHQNLMNWSRYHIISQISFVIPGNISELFEPLFAVLRASQCTLLPRVFFPEATNCYHESPSYTICNAVSVWGGSSGYSISGSGTSSGSSLSTPISQLMIMWSLSESEPESSSSSS